MEVLNGKDLSAKLLDELKGSVNSYKQTPILSAITIGNNPASMVYVNNMKLSCEYVGMSFLHIAFDEETPEEKVIKKIKELNKDKSINGIILLLPVPRKYNTDKLINAIDPSKDVDGLTTVSNGKMVTNEFGFIPCTPKGVLEIFDYYKIDIEGKNVVVVGKGRAVGLPMAIECMKRDATVIVCHSKTKDLTHFTKQADVLIVAVGKKWLINKDMIKKDAVIIDVGINSENGNIYGDVNPDVDELCSARTLVPDGTGPVTVATLLKNTFTSYKEMNGIKDEE